jgi:UDP-glucose 4-epimerase
VTRVVVTGGSGKLGSACVADLVSHGYHVVIFDRVRSADLPQESTFMPVDLTDYGPVLDAMLVLRSATPGRCTGASCSHPRSRYRAEPRHVRQQHERDLEHCHRSRRAGVKNIVWASSETVLGLPFDTPPPYVPVDENYPPRPESTYSHE